MTLCFGIK